MAENAEHIEAKLCAYVDGDLPPEDKAEIERLLAEHPAHAALLVDLVQQKRLLQGLPREAAPASLNQELRSQLERDALLDFRHDDQPPVLLRINRWTQYLSAAAVLLLALGLGFVVYSILPTRHPPMTALQQSAQEEREAAGRRDAAEAVAGGIDSQVAIARKGDDTLERHPGDMELSPFAVADAGVGSAAPRLMNKMGAAGARRGGDEALPINVEGRTVIITVQTSDVRQANSDVVNYLESNRINWSATDNVQQDRLREQIAYAMTNQRLQDRQIDMALAAGRSTTESDAARGGRGGQRVAAQAGAELTRSRTIDALLGAKLDGEAVNSPLPSPRMQIAAAQQAPSRPAPSSPWPEGSIVVLARQLTRDQIDRLAGDLSQPQNHQVALVSDTRVAHGGPPAAWDSPANRAKATVSGGYGGGLRGAANSTAAPQARSPGPGQRSITAADAAQAVAEPSLPGTRPSAGAFGAGGAGMGGMVNRAKPAGVPPAESEFYDCVIVVQAAAAPASQPATQPADRDPR